MAAEYLVWSSSLVTGIPEIDAQHRGLIEKVNGIYAAMTAGHEVKALLAELMVHTHAHFRFEETLMSRARYPGLKNHMLSHQALLARAQLQLDAYFNGEASPIALAKFISRAVVDHIKESDLAYVPYVAGGAAGKQTA
ncbi:MAG TPA: bacteriohemerythrin [Myxococcales bacterium]|nr:bacteriohemerythrin [Myxococcales bacterium]